MKNGMILFALFIGLFFAVGFGLLGYGGFSYYQGRRSLSWPQVPANISKCKIEENSDGDGTTWKVKVLYDYSVEGVSYSGDRIAYGYGGSSTREEHKAIHDKLINANAVFVKYDPADPNKSVLAAGFDRSTFLTIAFAITWLLFTTGFTILWVSSSGKDSKLLQQIQVIQ